MGNELAVLLDLAWKLLLVLALAFLATRLLRWLSSPTLTATSLLAILARQPIGAQQALLLVAVGKKRLLLGQTARQITLLAEIDAEDLLALDSSERGGTAAGGRRGWPRWLFPGSPSPGGPTDAAPGTGTPDHLFVTWLHRAVITRRARTLSRAAIEPDAPGGRGAAV
ncbi:MAG: flagellar biosynthetic protein FliO [Chloroflexi bacterium]|nr:flagellar biosynthetic protein FliO [Chloroflexota bacterium]